LAEGGLACIGKIPHPLSAHLSYLPYILQQTSLRQQISVHGAILYVRLRLLLYKAVGKWFNGSSVDGGFQKWW
jgi:hypothetical protein